MDREELKKKLQDMLAVVDEDVAKSVQITDETEIREGLGLDSLQIVELLFEIEEQLEVKIEDEEAQRLRTVGNLLDVIEQKMEAAGGE